MAEGREGWEGDAHALAQNEHPFPLGHAIWLDPDAEVRKDHGTGRTLR